MRVTLLGSGSRGNATLVEATGRAVLVDAGVPVATLRDRMQAALGRVPRLDGVVVTHAHGDHCAHAAAVSRAFEAPVYVSEATRRSLPLTRAHGVRVYGARAPFDVRGLGVRPMPVPHDAPQVALVLEGGGESVGITTDLGETPRDLDAFLGGCSLLVLESNHDPDLLRAGPYPPSVQARVAARTGHLSNGQAAAFLRRLPCPPRTVVLAHVSEANNDRRLALDAATEALRGRDTALHLADACAPLTLVARGRGQLGLAF